MDQVAPQFRAIAHRRQAIHAEIASLQARVKSLEGELGELEIAARVLHRLGLLTEDAVSDQQPPQIVSDESQPRPTVPEMIFKAVSEFTELGLEGATSQQVLAELTRRWGVSDPNVVRPTLWRMVRSERLRKRGDIYMLPGSAELNLHTNGSGAVEQTTTTPAVLGDAW